MGSKVEIKKVESKQDFKEFIELPFRLYRENPYWVPPLRMMIRETLDEEKYPFWKHARKELFLALRDGRTAGRIAAIIDDSHVKFHEEKLGFFGFFECEDDQETANALFDAAKKWLREKGMLAMRGPTNPSLNDECAFLLEGFEQKPVIMMPYTFRYYLKLAEGYGLKKSKDLISLLVHYDWGLPSRIEKLTKRIYRNMHLNVRSFDLKHFDRDVEIMKKVYNAAWEKNWGFVPMTDEEILYTGKFLKQFGDPRLVKIAEVDGKPVGIGLTVPNIDELLARLNGSLNPANLLKFLYYKNKVAGTRSLLGGTIKEFRNTGIILVMFCETQKEFANTYYKWCDFGWNLEDNELINKFDMSIGAKPYKKYRLYEMPI